MTYNVFSGTLNPTHSLTITHVTWYNTNVHMTRILYNHMKSRVALDLIIQIRPKPDLGLQIRPGGTKCFWAVGLRDASRQHLFTYDRNGNEAVDKSHMTLMT